MVIKIYFALVAALAAKATLPRYAAALLDGDPERAYDSVADVSDRGNRQLIEGDGDRLLAVSDALLLLDRDEEAEQEYRRAQKACRSADDRLRIMSCRNAGWQALKRARYFAAHSCFARMASDDGATLEQAIEASIGMGIVHHLMGQQRHAAEALEQAGQLAREADDPLWRDTVALLALDCAVRIEVCGSACLADHAFWQSGRESDAFITGAAAQRLSPEALHATRVPRPLIDNHLDYLRQLHAVSDGDAAASLRLAAIAADGAFWPGHSVPAEAKIAAVLAALGGGFGAMAERLLDTLTKREMEGVAPRWNLDLLYARAKVAQQRGQMQSALQLYASYSREALHCLRSEAVQAPVAGSRRSASAPTSSDDIAMRLPAKYRRAYRYIVEHIADHGLTTREVAAHIQVTERALQMMFKHSLGVSPGALIRQMRLEGIRDELRTDARGGVTVLDTARRWGVNSRSTLVKSYRKQFNESPSETLNG
ncbi:helix-turn-helix transcriptional regulator [Paraburkholderia xenovorans]|uniref:helix-turn-helix transcriptional regulator n=1 Tax=Paraburkholderia xenovorans TaxID=36873 RepID=UPI0038B9E3BA